MPALIFALSLAFTTQLPADDIGRVLQEYEAACGRITSFDIELQVQTTIPGQKPPPVEVVRQVYFDGRYRADLLLQRGPNFLPQKQWIWDKREETVILAEVRKVFINQSPANNERIGGMFFNRLYSEWLPGWSYASIIRSRDHASVELMDDGRISLYGPPTKELQAPYRSLGFKLFLDPAKGHMPSRVEHYTENNGAVKLWTIFENDLQQVADGIWIPASCRCTCLEVEKRPQGQPLFQTALKLEPKNSSFNTAIDDNTFRPGKFPKGTVITYRVNGEVSIVEDDDLPSEPRE